jgi:NAD(P)-dependent dehydrogenase (short-subunit alcohol dehydrogenase family)
MMESGPEARIMDNHCTLITGASSGIGREIAKGLSAERRLILNGRDETRLDETRQACNSPDQHLMWPQALDRVADVQRSFTDFLAHHQVRVSNYVHCAGTLKILPLRSIEVDHALEVLNTNFTSAFALMNVLVKKKVNDQKLRSVVFVSSIASQFGAKGFSIYAASKGALDALMKSLAVELAPDVRVNSVLPGAIKTEMTKSIFARPEVEDRFKRDYPLGVGETDDIVHIVEFLLSERARWITGQQLIVDGGRTVNITA